MVHSDLVVKGGWVFTWYVWCYCHSPGVASVQHYCWRLHKTRLSFRGP